MKSPLPTHSCTPPALYLFSALLQPLKTQPRENKQHRECEEIQRRTLSFYILYQKKKKTMILSVLFRYLWN